MLEEKIESEKHPPAETALAMLSFLQNELPAGGTAAEKRFIRLYGSLCDRIFGKILDPAEGYRHKDGGWFSCQSQWSRSTSVTAPPMYQSPQQGQQLAGRRSLSIKTQPLPEDPVVKLLGTAGKPNTNNNNNNNNNTGEQDTDLPPTLIEAISKESENRPALCYKFPFLGLPKSTQDIWLAVLEKALGGNAEQKAFCTENYTRLFASLLRKNPLEQTDLQRYRQETMNKNKQRTTFHLSPRGFNPPISPRQPSPVKDKTKTEEDNSPYILLSMLEYYIFLLVRYPLAAPIPKQPVPRTSSVHTRSVKEPYGDTVYFDIFKRTMRHFLPYKSEEGRHIAFHQGSHQGPGSRQSELFLRVIIALWIEVSTQIEPTQKVLQIIQERKTRAGDTNPPAYDLGSSFDLVQAKFDPPKAKVQKCLRQLIIRVVTDPSLMETMTKGNLTNIDWCLGPTMTALQQPFYNQVRTAFRHASIHVLASPFFSTFNAWLIWLEPWNTTTCKCLMLSALFHVALESSQCDSPLCLVVYSHKARLFTSCCNPAYHECHIWHGRPFYAHPYHPSAEEQEQVHHGLGAVRGRQSVHVPCPFCYISSSSPRTGFLLCEVRWLCSTCGTSVSRFLTRACGHVDASLAGTYQLGSPCRATS
jgi:hypothetical protein